MHFGANKKPVEVIKEGGAFGETHMRVFIPPLSLVSTMV